jgi:hypothetical protein
VRASYAHLTASGAVTTAPVSFIAALLTGGSEAATAIIREGSPTGPVVATLMAGIGQSVSFCPATPVVLMRGLYVELSGTGAKVTVVYG